MNNFAFFTNVQMGDDNAHSPPNTYCIFYILTLQNELPLANIFLCLIVT